MKKLLLTIMSAMLLTSVSAQNGYTITGTAEGITIRNAKYPLDNGKVECSYQYAVSNEVLPGETAEVSIANGSLLLIKDY